MNCNKVGHELALSVGGQPSRKREQIMKGGTCNCGPVQLDLKLFWSTESSCPNPNTSNKEHEVAISGSGDGFKEPLASTCDSQPKGGVGKRNCRVDAEKAGSRCSDEEESGIGSTRKKLRLSKEQSCYLEQSFNDNPTLNPKQKVALAKQLGLQPRQVEVWFQNRRARTKLKQTEVDCEYLKGMCQSLKEVNRRLRKELQDLKALKSPHEHAPTTKIGLCPSCEQVSSINISSTSNNSSSSSSSSKMVGFTTGEPKSWFCQFTKSTPAASRF